MSPRVAITASFFVPAVVPRIREHAIVTDQGFRDEELLLLVSSSRTATPPRLRLVDRGAASRVRHVLKNTRFTCRFCSPVTVQSVASISRGWREWSPRWCCYHCQKLLLVHAHIPVRWACEAPRWNTMTHEPRRRARVFSRPGKQRRQPISRDDN